MKDDKMPKVSIIIAVYNVEKYLKQCLDCLINQTLEDIEIICVDDGSTDKSLDILKEYQANDSRIKIIEQDNQGPGIARNNALDAAEGEYVMVVDPDDWLELESCELAYNQIKKNNNDFVLYGYVKRDDKTNEIIGGCTNYNIYKAFIEESHIDLSKIKNNFFMNGFSWNKIYSRKFIQDNSIQYAPFKLSEDIPFTCKAMILSRNISIINKPLYNYRIRNSSASFRCDNWEHAILSREIVKNFILDNELYEPYLNYYIEFSFNGLLYWYNKMLGIDITIKREFKKRIIGYMDSLLEYMDKKMKFRLFLFENNLEGIYYKFVRPIGKYCAVLPYRRIKTFVCRK